MKIGIYGGSFNPVHFGHIGMVKWVLEHTDLDEVWMLVSPKSPHKVVGSGSLQLQNAFCTGSRASSSPTSKASFLVGANDKFDLDTNYDERVKAARKAVKEAGLEDVVLPDGTHKRVMVSDFERNLPLPSYTANTLRELKRQHPDDEFSLLIGEDNWNVFDKWREWEYILQNYRVLVYPRKLEVGSWKLEDGRWSLEDGEAKAMVFLTDAPYFDVSSTQIREKMKKDLHK